MKKAKIISMSALVLSLFVIGPGIIELTGMKFKINYQSFIIPGLIILVLLISFLSFALKLKTTAAILGLIGQLAALIIMSICFFNMAQTNQTTELIFWIIILIETILALFALMIISRLADK